jgi:hypothetical protein
MKDSVGISMALPTPLPWYNFLNEFFDELVQECPNFVIKKCCVKHGGIQIELDNITTEISDQLSLIRENLFDVRLI